MVTRKKTSDKEEQARQLTKELVAALQSLVDAAGEVAARARACFEARVWENMDPAYVSWKAYCQDQLQTYTEHMSRELLAEINSELILDAGVSANAASAVTGTNDKTAKADAVKAATQRGSESSEPGQSRGADGKSYPREGARPRKDTPLKPPDKQFIFTTKNTLRNLCQHPYLSAAQQDDLLAFLEDVSSRLRKRKIK